MYQYNRTGPYDTAQDLAGDSYAALDATPHAFVYAVIDKRKPASAEDDEGELAGMMCYTRANEESLHVEIGHVRIATAYQRRGLATVAAALMTKHALDDASEQGGLGLARIEWRLHSLNETSKHVPIKLGYSFLGTIKYERLLIDAVARGKVGNNRPLPPRTKPGDLWRDVDVYDLTCEDWQHGARDKVLELLK